MRISALVLLFSVMFGGVILCLPTSTSSTRRNGREVKKEICDWPDGFYELAPEVLICDLYLHSKCKMDCTFFFFLASFRRKTNILVYTKIGLTHEKKKKKKVRSILHLK